MVLSSNETVRLKKTDGSIMNIALLGSNETVKLILASLEWLISLWMER